MRGWTRVKREIVNLGGTKYFDTWTTKQGNSRNRRNKKSLTNLMSRKRRCAELVPLFVFPHRITTYSVESCLGPCYYLVQKDSQFKKETLSLPPNHWTVFVTAIAGSLILIYHQITGYFKNLDFWSTVTFALRSSSWFYVRAHQVLKAAVGLFFSASNYSLEKIISASNLSVLVWHKMHVPVEQFACQSISCSM